MKFETLKIHHAQIDHVIKRMVKIGIVPVNVQRTSIGIFITVKYVDKKRMIDHPELADFF